MDWWSAECSFTGFGPLWLLTPVSVIGAGAQDCLQFEEALALEVTSLVSPVNSEGFVSHSKSMDSQSSDYGFRCNPMVLAASIDTTSVGVKGHGRGGEATSGGT